MLSIGKFAFAIEKALLLVCEIFMFIWGMEWGNVEES
jgi:hypothetical protein